MCTLEITDLELPLSSLSAYYCSFQVVFLEVALIYSTFADRYMYFALPSFALGICMIQQRVRQSLRWLSGTAIAGLYLGAFAGWMVFGTHADAWLPYQMYWFGGEILTFAFFGQASYLKLTFVGL